MIKVSEDETTMSTGEDLASTVANARAKAIAEKKAADITGVDLWVSEAKLTTPFPDRVTIVQLDDIKSLISHWASIDKDEILPGTILSIPAELMQPLMTLAKYTDIEVGYMTNPDQEYEDWVSVIRTLKKLDVMDIPAIFEPLHLPDPDKLDDSEVDDDQRSQSIEQGSE